VGSWAATRQGVGCFIQLDNSQGLTMRRRNESSCSSLSAHLARGVGLQALCRYYLGGHVLRLQIREIYLSETETTHHALPQERVQLGVAQRPSSGGALSAVLPRPRASSDAQERGAQPRERAGHVADRLYGGRGCVGCGLRSWALRHLSWDVGEGRWRGSVRVVSWL
jgi:hypothetical protein